MKKYIDKSAVVAEINRVLNSYDPNEITSGRYALVDLRDFIDTLETKEVDLEEAINGLTSGWIEGEEYGELQNINTACCVTLEEVKEAMRCIYELGLMHRKDNLYGNKY